MKQLSVFFYLKKGRSNEAGLAPIYGKITYLDSKSTFSTGIYIDPLVWVKTKFLTKSITQEEEKMRREINSIREKIMLSEEKLRILGQPILASILKDGLFPKYNAVVIQEKPKITILKIFAELLGNEFKMQIEAIVEGFSQMDTDLAVKGKHKAIISQELFGLVNGFLGENKSGFTHKRDNNTVPLKGFCTCGLCGYGFTGYDIEKAGKTYSYYKCQKNCSEVTISAPRLHELFIDKLKSYEINPIFIPVIKKQVVATFLQLTEKDIVKEKILKTQLADEKRKFKTLKENLGQGVVPRDVYDELEPSHRQNINQIEEELSKMSYDSSNLENQVQVALEAASNLLNFWNLLDYRWRQRLQRLVFPSGMSYFKKSNEVLTPEVNPIFSEIARVSRELEVSQIAVIGETQEISSTLSKSFASSNFLYDGLLLIIEFIDELKGNSPTIFHSAIYHNIDPISGVTQSIKYDYVSTTTGITKNIIQLPFNGAKDSHTIIPNLLFSGNSLINASL